MNVSTQFAPGRLIARIALCTVCTLGVLVVPVPLLARTMQKATTHPPTRHHEKLQQVCFPEVFSDTLPGKVDYCLGMRDWNRGDYDSGLKFLKLAAGWGSKSAQYTLGLIYYGGHHVPVDVALGLAWMKLADERHNDDQISQVMQSAFKWATPAQRQRADALFREMVGTYGDKVAAARALRHLHQWQSHHDAFDSGCVRLTGAQAAAARRLGLAGVPPGTIRKMLQPSHPISMPAGGGAKARRIVRRQRTFYSLNNAGVCVTMQMRNQVTRVLANKYFAGYVGVVSVGPLKQVSAPASSSTH